MSGRKNLEIFQQRIFAVSLENLVSGERSETVVAAHDQIVRTDFEQVSCFVVENSAEPHFVFHFCVVVERKDVLGISSFSYQEDGRCSVYQFNDCGILYHRKV